MDELESRMQNSYSEYIKHLGEQVKEFLGLPPKTSDTGLFPKEARAPKWPCSTNSPCFLLLYMGALSPQCQGPALQGLVIHLLSSA